jgi:hypothetical protein
MTKLITTDVLGYTYHSFTLVYKGVTLNRGYV